MARELEFQDPGEGIHEAEVIEILVSKGDSIEEGQDVVEVETDKAVFLVSAPFSGTVEEIHVREGDTIHVGDTLMTIAAAEEAEAKQAPEEREEEDESAEAEQARTEHEEEDESAGAGELEEKREREEEREPAEKLPEAKLEEFEKEPAEASREKGRPDKEREPRARPSRRGGPVPASPATRRVARELGVDLAEVEGSGDEGRVLLEDVRAAADRGRQPAERPAGARKARRKQEVPELPDFSLWGEVERKPLRSVRRTTARRMARSWEQIPHVTHNDLADVTELEAFRRRHAEEIERRGGKLTLTVLVMKAVVAALSDHPRFNTSLDPEKEELIYKRYYHLGVALDSERGLLVPTIRDVDRKSLGELARELSELAERARAGKVSREDMAGSTFTISNVGPMGGTHFTPIINYPEVAILGMARARLQNVVRGTLEEPEVVTRFLLPLSLGFDHRVNDGADAARFLNRVIEVLSDVESFALAV